MPRPKPQADPDKQLMIKVRATQRLGKEAKYYISEVKENEEKLAKMKSDGKDPYDIKKFEEVLGESKMMVPDSENRYKKSLQDLKDFMSANEDDFKDQEKVATAKTFLESE